MSGSGIGFLLLFTAAAVSPQLDEFDWGWEAEYVTAPFRVRPLEREPGVAVPLERGDLATLALFGDFARIQPEVARELVALRAGIEPFQLELLSQHCSESFHCTSYPHRVLPGETLESIAALYGAAAEEIARLNRIEHDVSAWDRIQVPAPLFLDGRNFRLRAVVPHWNRHGRDGEGVYEQSILIHEVVDGDTWENLAQRYRTTPAILRSVNGDGELIPSELMAQLAQLGYLSRAPDPEDPDGEPLLGTRLVVGTTLATQHQELASIVLYLERFLWTDLERVLSLNGLAQPDQLDEADRLRVPLAGLGGYEHLWVFGDGGVVALNGPTHVAIARDRSHQGEGSFTVRVRNRR